MKKVLAFGTFDIIHPGHEWFLRQAKKLGNKLVIVVARSETVAWLKGHQPLHSSATRVRRLRQLGIAWRVRLGNLDDKLRVVAEEKPDIIALGYDQKFFVNTLKKRYSKKIKIVRLPAYRPNIFKTSKLLSLPPRQIVVVLALLVKNRRLLLLRRRDPRPEFNNKWEWPGGGVEYGETVEHCLRREMKEETGFAITSLCQFPRVAVFVNKTYRYQGFLITFLCRARAGRLKISNQENSAARWCTLAQMLRLSDLLPVNKKIIRNNLTLLKKYVD